MHEHAVTDTIFHGLVVMIHVTFYNLGKDVMPSRWKKVCYYIFPNWYYQIKNLSRKIKRAFDNQKERFLTVTAGQK